jgi:uncharacterized protein (UPF0276 family)
MFESLPVLGAGLGYQPELHEDIVAARDKIDFLEIPTDTFLRNLPDWSERLLELRANFTNVAHGVYMSLGEASGPHLDYLERLAPYLHSLEPIWFSDHLDMGNLPSDAKGRYFHGVQVPFTRGQAAVFQQNMQVMRERVGLPLLVENLFYELVIPMPGSLSEPVFLREVLDGTDVGLLLDVENLYLNSLNFHFDPYQWLSEAPLERTVEIHVAGGEQRSAGPDAGKWSDTHSQPVPDEVWRLVEYVVARASVKAILVERDQSYPPMEELLAELDIARRVLGGAASIPTTLNSTVREPSIPIGTERR